MGFNRLHEQNAPQQVFVSADNDVARIPHRFILQYVGRKHKEQTIKLID